MPHSIFVLANASLLHQASRCADDGRVLRRPEVLCSHSVLTELAGCIEQVRYIASRCLHRAAWFILAELAS